MDSTSWHIDIVDSNFYYIEKEYHMPRYFTDTLAICKWEWVDKNLIKINSRNPLFTALSSMKVSQAVDNTLHDSIMIVFKMPNSSILRVEIYDNKFKTHVFKYSKTNKGIKLPIGIKGFSFAICNESLLEHNYGKFNGIVSFSIIDDIEIEKGKNLINVDIPAIDDTYFERYYVIDEFVYIKDNCIYWQGQKFKKRK